MNKRNNKGSSIVAVVIITMLVLILIGAMFMVASSYYNGSVTNNDERQAYLFAKSEAKILADGLKREGVESAYYPKKEEGTWNLKLSKTSSLGNKNYVKLVTNNVCKYKLETRNDGIRVVTYKVIVGYNNKESTVTYVCYIDKNDDVTEGKYS
ncbi:hypothetical protein [Sharpea azabuensis]|uniref:hypothetical protein n=1 Tax=Sharpea azabuensis TaxID=322505 RepID=UPI0013DCC710|nr:hypothetical protein [Sharpea azabuensis]